jgi:hypothetical protein
MKSLETLSCTDWPKEAKNCKHLELIGVGRKYYCMKSNLIFPENLTCNKLSIKNRICTDLARPGKEEEFWITMDVSDSSFETLYLYYTAGFGITINGKSLYNYLFPDKDPDERFREYAIDLKTLDRHEEHYKEMIKLYNESTDKKGKKIVLVDNWKLEM